MYPYIHRHVGGMGTQESIKTSTRAQGERVVLHMFALVFDRATVIVAPDDTEYSIPHTHPKPTIVLSLSRKEVSIPRGATNRLYCLVIAL